jgi:hypothetical protein
MLKDKVIELKKLIGEQNELFHREINLRHDIINLIVSEKLKVKYFVSTSKKTDLPKYEDMKTTTFENKDGSILITDINKAYKIRKVIPIYTKDDDLFFVIKDF